MPKSRNVRLSPLQRDLLWTLEEAGSETLITVAVTLHHDRPEVSPDQFLVELGDVFLGLCVLGYISLSRDLPPSTFTAALLSQQELQRFWVGDVICWDVDARGWALRQTHNGLHPEVMLTDAGAAALTA